MIVMLLEKSMSYADDVRPKRYFICSFMLLSCTAYAIAIVITAS